MTLDSHTHAWGYPSREHPWVNGPLVDRIDAFSVEAAYTVDRLRRDMARTGVDRAVVVGYPICEWTDNWYTARCVADHDDLLGVAMVDPFADDAGERVRELAAVDGMVGVRLGAVCPRDRMWETFDPSVTWLREATSETAFWTAVEETGLAVQVLADVGQLDQVVEMVEAHSDVPYLLDHFSHADPAVPPGEGPFARYADLASHENVLVKVSEAVHRSDEAFPYADLHDHVRWLLSEFGRERVVWGSDFPNVSDEATYGEALRWLDAVDGLSTGDREWVTGRAFERALL